MLPLLMTEDYWSNSQFSIARHYGQIKIGSQLYIIVDKLGRDIFECSALAENEGRDYAIEPGEPVDLIDRRLQPSYRRLGRDRIIGLLRAGKSLEEIDKTDGNENL